MAATSRPLGCHAQSRTDSGRAAAEAFDFESPGSGDGGGAAVPTGTCVVMSGPICGGGWCRTASDAASCAR